MNLALLFAGKRMEVTGLSPGTTYFFYLSAGNKVGFGKSVKLKIKTPRHYPKQSGALHPTSRPCVSLTSSFHVKPYVKVLGQFFTSWYNVKVPLVVPRSLSTSNATSRKGIVLVGRPQRVCTWEPVISWHVHSTCAIDL